MAIWIGEHFPYNFTSRAICLIQNHYRMEKNAGYEKYSWRLKSLLYTIWLIYLFKRYVIATTVAAKTSPKDTFQLSNVLDDYYVNDPRRAYFKRTHIFLALHSVVTHKSA